MKASVRERVKASVRERLRQIQGRLGRATARQIHGYAHIHPERKRQGISLMPLPPPLSHPSNTVHRSKILNKAIAQKKPTEAATGSKESIRTKRQPRTSPHHACGGGLRESAPPKEEIRTISMEVSPCSGF